MKDEAIIEKGIDKRPFALRSRRQVFAVTNSRIIRLERPLLGGFQMKDFQWKDLEDARVSENVLSYFCGSTLYFKADIRKLDWAPAMFLWSLQFFPNLKLLQRHTNMLSKQSNHGKRREELDQWKKREQKQVE